MALVLAGCGGSHHSGAATPSAASTPATPSMTTATGPPPTATSGPTTTPSTTATTPTTKQGTTPASPPVPSGARIPATYLIKSGDQASPTIVSVPALVPIALTLVSADGKRHQALVRTSPAHALTVPASGRASLVLPGQRDGRYVILLDHGAGVAQLLVGGEPGP